MQKRQIRLSTQTQIRQQLAGFMNKKINIVLNDSRVFLTELIRISGDQVTVQNMRQRKLTIQVSEINEIIIDINN
jgi:ribosome maturation factor RimP